MSTSTESWRALSEAEISIIGKLLSRDFPGRHELRMQLLSARVSPIDRQGSLQFRVVGPAAPVETRVPTEAHYFDGPNEDSGPAVHLLITLSKASCMNSKSRKDDDTAITVLPADMDLTKLHLF
ncbi:hypothetical protein [Rhizobium mongolense]|uniref:hypothetical protein n=1 Tax=Rhizobium mongolense TaxID=57676 RepID=UPI0034A5A15A